MKVTLKAAPTEEPKPLYPRLKISDDSNDLVVLFYAKSSGIVVSNSRRWGIGHYSSCWNEYNFKDYDGVVELSN